MWKKGGPMVGMKDYCLPFKGVDHASVAENRLDAIGVQLYLHGFCFLCAFMCWVRTISDPSFYFLDDLLHNQINGFCA